MLFFFPYFQTLASTAEDAQSRRRRSDSEENRSQINERRNVVDPYFEYFLNSPFSADFKLSNPDVRATFEHDSINLTRTADDSLSAVKTAAIIGDYDVAAEPILASYEHRNIGWMCGEPMADYAHVVFKSER